MSIALDVLLVLLVVAVIGAVCIGLGLLLEDWL